MNIKSKQDLLNAITPCVYQRNLAMLTVEADLRYGPLDDNNFWQHRDFLRLNWSGAEGVLSDKQWEPAIYAGNFGHFLHYSQTTGDDGEQMVAYTKHAENGRADIQTRTTLEAYQETYGQVETNEDLMPAKEEQANPAQEQVTQDFNAKEPVQDNSVEDVAKQREADAFLRGAIMAMNQTPEAEVVEGYDELIVKAVYKALNILDIIAKKGV